MSEVREIFADSTVLIFLAKLRKLHYLKKLYSKVLIPEKIFKEVVIKGKELGERDATIVENAISTGWIEVKKASKNKNKNKNKEIEKFGLEKGEIEVLSLSVELNHEEVLADEESVREIARILNLSPRGTIYVLLRILKEKTVDLNNYLKNLEELIELGFYMHERVYLEAVRRGIEISGD